MARKRRTLDDFEEEHKPAAEWLTPKEAAAFTGLGVSTLGKMRMAKTGPAFAQVLPNAVRYSRKALQDFMQSKVVPQAAE
jgi:hypothetical protein